jgi:pimeloyl-ACP methyl ester carboxylesterase
VPTVTRSRDGVSIHYEIHSTGDPTAVLVHGWGFDRRIWDAAIPRLARTRRVAALDLAGHGQSGRERRRPTVASFAEDVCAVVEAVGAPSVVLVGHSMGGDVIVEAARSLTRRVVGLVLVDTLLDVEAARPEGQLAAFFAALEADFPSAIAAFFREWMFTPATDPALRESIVARAQAMDPEIGVAALRSAFTYDPREPLRALCDPGPRCQRRSVSDAGRRDAPVRARLRVRGRRGDGSLPDAGEARAVRSAARADGDRNRGSGGAARASRVTLRRLRGVFLYHATPPR